MKKIVVNGITYLGNTKEGKKKTYITNACLMNGPEEDWFLTYLSAKNLGELESFTSSGNGHVTVHPLTAGQKLNLKIAKLEMEASKGSALKKLENKEFSSRMGK